MHVLSPRSFEIFLEMINSFEFYVFSVFFMYSDEDNQKKLFDDSLHSKTLEFANKSSDHDLFQTKISELHELYKFQERFQTLKSDLIRIKDRLENQLEVNKDEHYDIPGRKLLEKLLNNNSLFDTLNTKPIDEIFSKSIVAVESVFFIFE